jgi:hypothetical protein
MNEWLRTVLADYGEERAWRLVKSLGSKQSLGAFERIASIETARRMLGEGQEPNYIQHRLAGKYGFHVKTAQRRMRMAGWNGKS